MNLPAKYRRLPRRSLLFFAAILVGLSAVSAWYFRSQPSIVFQQRLLQRYLTTQQQDADRLLQDTALMTKLVLKRHRLDEFNTVAEKRYGFFLFAETFSDEQEPLFWNNQKILPPQEDFNTPDGISFRLLPNGYYVVQRTSLRLPSMTNNVVAYVLIPILHKYYLQNEYLRTEFAHDKTALKQIALSDTATDLPISSLEGKPLFYIKRIAHAETAPTHSVTFLLRLAALLVLLMYLQLTADAISRRYGITKAILFLGFVLVLIRAVIFLYPQVLSLRQYPLFDPAVYASNWFNRSLGDLLINTIVICWLVLFTWFGAGPAKGLPGFIKGRAILPVGLVAIFLLVFTSFQVANVVSELVNDSHISFNVIDFFSLDTYTVYGFVALALITLAYYYISQLLFRAAKVAFPNLWYLYAAVAIVGLIFLTLRTGESIVLFHLPVLAWLVIYTLLLSRETFIINRFRITTAGVLFWLFLFSVSLALLIMQGNREVELRNRRRIADKYDQLTDPSRERILSIASTYLDNRWLLGNFNRFEDDVQNKKIRDSIITEFAAFGNPYNTQVYVFDAANNPVNNDDVRSFAELNTLFSVQGRPMGLPDLSYVETSYDQFAYVLKRTIQDSVAQVGSFFVLAASKQYQNTAAPYPEFFRQTNRNEVENSPLYSYAVYKDLVLRNHSSRYAFPIQLNLSDVPQSEIEQRQHTDDGGEYDELWYKASNSKVVVVLKKQDSLIESITLFSYLFGAFLLLVGLLRFFGWLLPWMRNRSGDSLFSKLTIRSQIHGTIIFISVLSFLIIGVATISFFISRYNRANVDRLSRTANVTLNEIQKRIDETRIGEFGFSNLDSATATTMQNLVKEIADVHDVDANIYDTLGELQMSSYKEVYSRGILSTRMHPLAYYRLNNLKEVQRVQNENMSSLTYLSIYTAIRRKDGAVYGYLNIPYFSSQFDLRQEISNFFVTIINLNAFIFLLAGVIALFITNKITRSFSVIGNKMKEITLGKAAEEIQWNREDEIGELVTQYNKMVNQLEQSAEALAKSEREGAWREMARQVAHEIKNPLTPMKLSIQYLQKAIQNNQPNVQVLTTSVATTLIEQIDHLSKIAADFSQFANIGNKKLEVVDLHNIIGSLTDLWSSNPKVTIEWNRHEEGLFMRADKTHMNRLFTNLLTNAVDACMGKEDCKISISEAREFGKVTIAITDNGEGIPEATRPKIFTPNFTTKTSGTGLGLAMCKSIVEQAGGDIYFETAEAKGTTFYVQLPLVS